MVHHGLSEGQGLQVLAFGQATEGNGPLVKWSKTPASHAGNMGSNPVRVTSVHNGTQREMRIRQNETVKSCFR